MIKLLSMDLSDYNSQHSINLQISHAVLLDHMPIIDYFPRYNPENVLENNSLLQLFVSIGVGNGLLDSYSLNIMMNKAPCLSLLLCNEYINALPYLFNKVFVLHTDSNTAVGFNVVGIKENARKSLLKLREENRIDPYLNNMFKFCEQQKTYIPHNNRFFHVINDGDLQIPKSFLASTLVQYLLKQCLFMGECMIPIIGFTEEEILPNLWLEDLANIFDRVIILTTNESKWITQGLIVSNIRKEILGLTSENGGNSYSSIGVIGGY